MNKKRTPDFDCKDNDVVDFHSDICNVMTLSEASKRWGLNDSTLRKLVKTDKLIENIDYRKSGNVWLISENSMRKIYGGPKENNIL